jgi:formiminotetrahydrofolate cyclodeaminase
MSDAGRAPFSTWTQGAFTDALAAKRSVPGGGAAAGSALAHAAALGSMVISFTRGKARYAEHETMLAETAERLEHARSEGWRLADLDADGFEALSALWPLAPDDPARVAGWASAVRAAVEAPRDVVRVADALATDLAALVGRTSPLLRSDLAIAGRFTVEMNLEALAALPGGGADESASLASEIPATIARVQATADRIDAACRTGGRETI